MEIVIIGGGISGLSCGVFLSSLGHNIKILESKPFAGGRAYSFIDPITGNEIDNGQHILMGCYSNTFRFLKLIGSYNRLQFQNNFHSTFRDLNKNILTLDFPALPAPLHLLFGLRNLHNITISDKISLLKISKAIYLSKYFPRKTQLTVAEFLQENDQSDYLKALLWNPVTISAMNGSPNDISADLFKRTIFEMFFRNHKNSRIVLPTVGLNDLFVTPAVNFIKNKGSEIHLNSAVKDFNFKNGILSSLLLQNNETIKGDLFISSLPYFNLLKFPALLENLKLQNIVKMKSSPIISIYLWLKKDLLDEDFVSLINSNSQVLFNRSRILNFSKNGNQYCLVISAANHLINSNKEYILSLISKELEQIFYSSQKIEILNSRIIKERNATLLLTPQIENFRPSQETGIKNFFLIGDWINTGLPATIESAIKSSSDMRNFL